jgi:hypothetical protein
MTTAIIRKKDMQTRHRPGVRHIIVAIVCAPIWLAPRGARSTPPGDAHRSVEQEIAACRKSGIPVSAGELQAPIPPESENAARLYLQWPDLRHAKRIAATDETELLKLLDFRLPDSAVQAGFKVFDSRRDAFALIHRAASMPNCGFKKDWSLGPAVLFPELAEMRDMVRWLEGESGALARRGKPVEAVQALALGLRIEKHVLSTRSSLHCLVAVAIDGMVTKGMFRIAAKNHNRPDVLRAVLLAVSSDAPALNQGDMLMPQVVSIINTAALMRRPESDQRQLMGVRGGSGEAMSVIGVLKNLMNSDEAIDPTDLQAMMAVASKPGASIADWKAKRMAIVLPVIETQPARSDRKTYDRWVDDNEATAIRTIRPILAVHNLTADRMLDAGYDACGALQAELVQYMTMNARSIQPKAGAAGIPPTSTSLACLFMNEIMAQLRQQPINYALANRALLRAAVGIFAYQTKNGSYPASLQQIVNGPLRDPFNGQTLKYRRDSSGFMVYSVGRTGKYDGLTDPQQRKEARLHYPIH